MKKFMGWCILLIIFCVAGVSGNAQAADDPQIWAGQTGVVEREVPAGALPTDSESCSGVMMPIETKSSDGTTMACVFGEADGLRLARLRGGNGFIYAVAYATEVKYAVIRDFCVNARFCVYGQSEDVAVIQTWLPSGYGSGHSVVKHFSKHLAPYLPDNRYVQYTPDVNPLYVTAGSQEFPTGAVAVSSSGRWAVVELQAYGFVRIDLRTLRMQRVIAPGVVYGLGADPQFELAVSDDGSKVVVTGVRTGINVYEVTENCGDDLSKGVIERNFSAYVTRCQQASINPYQLIPGFLGAQTPHFSADGSRLSVFVPLASGNKVVTLAPQESVQSGAGDAYVAFGDSFTSGEGEVDDAFYVPSTNTATNRCHVSTRSYPFLLGKWWELPTRSYACSRSQVPDIAQTSDQARVANEVPRLISLGVGGNDVGLVGKLKSCLGIGTCEWAKSERRASTAEEIRALFPKVTKLITKLKNDYSQPPLLVVGYPRVINTMSTTCNSFVTLALTPDERRYFDESIIYMNRILRAAAQSTHTTYVDIEDALVGERLCDMHETAMNTLRLGSEIAPLSFLANVKVIGAESFHPTPRGHQLIAQKIQGVLNDFWQSPYCESCHFDDTLLTPSSYWTEDTPASSLRQIARQFMYAKELQTQLTHLFAFPAGTFQPGVKVRIELHSNPVQLGEYTAREDGSLQGSIEIPAVERGYHTVHAIEVSHQTAEEVTIDRYETVYVYGAHDLQQETQPQGRGAPPHNINKPAVELSLPSGDVAVQGEVTGVDLQVESTHSLGVLGVASQHVTKHDKGTQSTASSSPALKIIGISSIALVCLAILLWLIWAQRGETGEK